MPGARCTRSLVRKVVVAHELVTTVAPGSPGIPARNGFNSLFRALPGDRAPSSVKFLSPTWRQRRGVRTTRLRRPQ
jgi:hypothetical protein